MGRGNEGERLAECLTVAVSYDKLLVGRTAAWKLNRSFEVWIEVGGGGENAILRRRGGRETRNLRALGTLLRG